MRRRTAITAAIACGIVAIGTGTMAVDTLRAEAPAPLASPAMPSPSSGAPSEPVTAPTRPATSSAAPELEVRERSPQALPVSLSIPSIAVETELEQLGTLPDGALATPVDTDLAGWFSEGPRPGAQGPAVIAGHVSWNGDPSVFFRLSELTPGDAIAVRQEDGSEAEFRVTRLEQHAKDEFPTVAVYSNTDGPELRLITCGGEFDSGTGHFRDNIVVFAELAGN